MFKGKVLGRSFKPAKCKSSLKLAVSRIKLLKNKREAVVKQIRRDIAHLLELGQEQTARLQVEHVVREEKMMAAYEYIEIFCEFIAARMLIIESQKTCPNDLKEAISSLIFASPRCADIPELKDATKNFEAKYGKEFVSAAIELRPDCGIHCTLVEKLSAVGPDDRTKLKILSSIAEEHKIKWYQSSHSGEDIEPREGVQVFHDYDDRDGVPTFVIPLQPDQGSHRATINVIVGNMESPLSQQRNVDTRIGLSVTLNPEPSRLPSASRVKRTEIKEPSGDFEFTDATSAAQAAAEAAEHASWAARAAVELSRSGKYMTAESDYGRGRESRATFNETDAKEASAESEVVSENEIRVDQESSDGDFAVFDGLGISRMVDERSSSADRTVDTEQSTEHVRLNLEKLPISCKHRYNKFRHLTSSEKTTDQTVWSREPKSYKAEPSPRKSLPFFDSESEDSSEDNAPSNRPAYLVGQARVDPTFSQRTKKR